MNRGSRAQIPLGAQVVDHLNKCQLFVERNIGRRIHNCKLMQPATERRVNLQLFSSWNRQEIKRAVGMQEGLDSGADTERLVAQELLKLVLHGYSRNCVLPWMLW